jgi:hypothetical protein
MRRMLLAGVPLALAAAWALAPGNALASGVSATKTTTSLGGTDNTSPGTMTGVITISDTSGTTYTVVDAFEALPNGNLNMNRFYLGTYAITLTCTGATTNTPTTETISGTGVFPLGPAPTNSGAPTVTLTAATATCDYTITYSGTAPSGTIVSLKNDIWLYNGTTFGTSTAGPSISAPFGTVVPAGAIGGIGVAVLIGGGFLFVQIRRERSRAAARA